MASANKAIIYSLPSKIRETRKNMGWTQTDLGLAMGSDKTAVCKMEKGDRIPDLVTVANAADAMGAQMSAWFGGISDPYFANVQERAKKLTPEQRQNLELMINAALQMACFSSAVQTAPSAGQAEEFNYKIYRRTTSVPSMKRGNW